VHRLRLRILASTLLATTVVISACEGGGTSSSDGGEGGTPIATREMQISASVEAEDDVTAEISVTLYDSKLGTFLLTGGDALSACVGALCKPLTYEARHSAYEAELPYLAETAYTISLSRAGGTGAPNSSVALPVPFAILAPAPGLNVTDGDSVTVQWAPAGADDVVDVMAETRCTHPTMDHLLSLGSLRRGRLAENVDSGVYVADVDTILDSRWVIFTPREPASTCQIVIEVVQKRVGTIDTGFVSGSVRGVVSRKVTFDYRRRL